MSKGWLELLARVRADLAEEASARMLEAGASAVERRDGANGASTLITHIPLENGATAKLRAMEALLAALGARISARGAALDSRALKGWRGRVDFIAANLFLDALAELAPRVREALAPGGRGVLSGIGHEQADALARACREARLEVRGTSRLEEWASLEIAKP